MKNLLLALSASGLIALSANAEVREYTLNTSLDSQSNRILINNSTIAPSLYANEGDTLRIIVNNQMDVATSIHWHGVLLPNDQDGVPNITTQEIAPKGQFIYEYEVKQTGTYWYHSHTGLQEQQGLYGSIVFNDDLQEQYGYAQDQVIMLSDYSTTSIEGITQNLDKTGMHERSSDTTSNGHMSGHDMSGHNMMNSSENMAANNAHSGGHMSDIYYDNILINNNKDNYDIALDNAGDWVRLRVINAGASSYFKLSYDAPIYVIAADGLPIKPVAVQSLQIVNGETYDILVQAGANAQKILVEAIDQNIQAALNISATNTDTAASAQKDFIAQAQSIAHLDDISVLEPLNKPAQAETKEAKNLIEVDFELTGSMMPYSWSINNKVFGEAESIKVSKDDKVRIRFINKTDMPHPMHLHGFFFNVVRKDGSLSIPKHTINVDPEETVIIEFNAGDDFGKWVIHCHNLYHMKYGMMQMIEVQ